MPLDSYNLTIHEVSRKFNVSKHTLRYWEKELKGIIVPLRTKGRQRRYNQSHLIVIDRIKNLKQTGLTLSEIRERLARELQLNNKNLRQIDYLANRIADKVKIEIYNFFNDNKER